MKRKIRKDRQYASLDEVFRYPIVCVRCRWVGMVATKKADLSSLTCIVCGGKLVYQTRSVDAKLVTARERNNNVSGPVMEPNDDTKCYGNERINVNRLLLGDTKMAKANFSSLNKALPCTTKGKTKKRRISSGNRNDAVADALAKCSNAEEVALIGIRFGLTETDIRNRAKAAKNFGLFRMVIGNLCRGVVNRIAQAKEKGVKLTVAQAAYPKEARKVVAKKTKKASRKQR